MPPAVDTWHFEIPREPRCEESFDEIAWLLMNPNVRILKKGRRWSVMIVGDCRMLARDHRCRVYEARPFVCRDYPEASGQDCHGKARADLEGRMFSSPEELLKYLAEERNYSWAKTWLYQLFPGEQEDHGE
ncbi:MAG: YkgJ family cysteine cluster protein [Comamonadaceae bacterium]|nr:YkgJ family cysteine cluster protein [Comamonadaceae bacterium]